MEKFQNKYRIPSARLKGYDYGSNGLYFVTICTKEKIHYFGNIVETHDYASPIINTNPVETDDCPSPNKTNLKTDNYLSLQEHKNIKQTHNHASLRETEIGKVAREFWQQIPLHFPFVELDEFIVMPNHVHGIIFINKPEETTWIPNNFGSQSRNLASIIRGFKASVKRFANQNNIEFEWQSRYHDRIIRSYAELDNIREYIINNPIKWSTDEYYNTI